MDHKGPVGYLDYMEKPDDMEGKERRYNALPVLLRLESIAARWRKRTLLLLF